MEETKKLIWPNLLVMILAMFTQATVVNMLYTDLPFLIRTYFPDIEQTDIGKYTGPIVSLYNLGQIPGFLFFGWYADRYGRRNILIVSTLICVLCCFAFGLTTNYSVALVIRFIWGLVDCTLCLTKTVVSESCSKDMLPFSTSLILVANAISSTVSPLIGGYLSNPDLIPGLTSHVPYLKKVPFFIPFALIGCFGLITALLIFCYVIETLTEEERQKQEEMRHNNKERYYIVQEKIKNNIPLTDEDNEMIEIHNDNYCAMLKNPAISGVTALYGMQAFVQIGYDTLYSIWLSSSRSTGGLALTKEVLGIIVSFASPFQISTSLLSSVFTQYASATRGSWLMLLLQAICYFIFPFVSKLPEVNETLLFCLLYSLSVAVYIVRTLAFNEMFVLIANSSYQEFRAKTFGLASVVGSFGRFLGPTVFPSLFDWSIEKARPFPFDYSFSLILLSVMSCVGIVITLYLPSSVNQSRGSIFDKELKKPLLEI